MSIIKIQVKKEKKNPKRTSSFDSKLNQSMLTTLTKYIALLVNEKFKVKKTEKNQIKIYSLPN